MLLHCGLQLPFLMSHPCAVQFEVGDEVFALTDTFAKHKEGEGCRVLPQAALPCACRGPMPWARICSNLLFGCRHVCRGYSCARGAPCQKAQEHQNR